MKKIIVANWKMNPDTPREARELFVLTKRAAQKARQVKVVVCPPAIFLPLLKAGGGVTLGGQDVSSAPRGAYTGVISAAQLHYAGAEYVILGHSERRAAGDNDELINLKMRLALKTGLKVILCIGERERDHHGHYLRIIREQLEWGLAKIPRGWFEKIIIAYEPVWAIGDAARGSDTPEAFLEQAIFIRKVLTELVSKKQALTVPILYGGSVDDNNAADFLTRGEADGLLVGRASLDSSKFKRILWAGN